MAEPERKDWREGKTLARFNAVPASPADETLLQEYCAAHGRGWCIGCDAENLGVRLTGPQITAELARQGLHVKGVTREIAWAGHSLGLLHARHAGKGATPPEYAARDAAWAARRARIKWQYVKRSPGMWLLGDALVTIESPPPDDQFFWSMSIEHDDAGNWTCEAYTRQASAAEIAALTNPVRKATRSKSANRALRKTLAPCVEATGLDVDRLVALVRYVRLARQSPRRMALRAEGSGVPVTEYTTLCAAEQARLLEQIAGPGAIEL